MTKQRVENKDPKRLHGADVGGGGRYTSPGRPAAVQPPLAVDPDAEAKRERAKERARLWRVAQKAKQDPEGAARLAAEQAEKEAAAKAAAEAEAKARAEAAAQLDALIIGGLTGLVDASTAAIQAIWLDASRPGFGPERARIVAQAWAPVVRPHLAQWMGDNPEVMMAVLVTGGVLGAWIAEYQSADGKAAAPRPAAPPTIVPDATATA